MLVQLKIEKHLQTVWSVKNTGNLARISQQTFIKFNQFFGSYYSVCVYKLILGLAH